MYCRACSNEINTLEQRLSRTIETSSVAQLNANGSAQLDDDTAALLQAGAAIQRRNRRSL